MIRIILIAVLGVFAYFFYVRDSVCRADLVGQFKRGENQVWINQCYQLKADALEYPELQDYWQEKIEECSKRMKQIIETEIEI